MYLNKRQEIKKLRVGEGIRTLDFKLGEVTVYDWVIDFLNKYSILA